MVNCLNFGVDFFDVDVCVVFDIELVFVDILKNCIFIENVKLIEG